MTDEQKSNEDLTTAEILIDKLIAWEVEVVFGLVGDGVNPIFEAIRKRGEEIRLITVRHEEAAAFMASGYAKCTGKLGVCLATTGPGAVHLLNGLADAALEGAPVLAITGVVYHDLLGTSFMQEVDTVPMLEHITVYNQQITGPLHAQTIVDLACRTALTVPGVAHLTMSTDVQLKRLSEDKPSAKSGHLTGTSVFTPRIDIPADEELTKTAALLNSHHKIMILAGRGALKAREEVQQLASRLGAPVAKALLGKAVLPDDSPYTTGGIGRLGTLPSLQMMQECTLLLILGSTMPYLEYYPQPERAQGIQIDNDPRRIGLRFPVEIGLHGDVRATLQALLPKLDYQADRSFLELAQSRMKEWRATLAAVEVKNALPVKASFLAAEVGRHIHKDAMITIDTGAHTLFTARHLQLNKTQEVLVCGNLASMAPGLPYAIAAQIAQPDRQVVAMVGDGGFTMLMGEMATAVLYRLPVKVIIFKNNVLALDRFEQEEIGNPAFGIALQNIDFVKIAEACGAEGYTCKRSEEIAPVLRQAFASPNPCVIEVEVDPDESPAPPEELTM